MKLTQNDVLKIIELIRINYDNAYSGYNTEQTQNLRDFWYENLKNYPKEIVFESIYILIRRNEFAPRLANIIDKIEFLQNVNAPTNEQLWAELTAVLDKVYQISRYLPYPQYSQWTDEQLNGIYDGLSDELKLFVVNRSTLIEIAEMTEENLQYERARFFKQMPALRQHYYDSLDAKEFLLLTQNGETLKQIENKKHN